jgi:hypothetical protein
MGVHTELSPAEAADRLAIRELFDAYARCADRRDAEGQKALFTDDTRFAVYMDGEGTEPTYVLNVADLRAATARVARDSSAAALVRDLRQASPEFARMWDQHTISAQSCNVKQARNDRVGRIDLECGTVLSPQSQQRLLFLQPLAGTPAAGRLARLASDK